MGLTPHTHLVPKVPEKIRAIPLLTLSTCVAYKNSEILPTYFNFSTCFGLLCAHHQENLLYLCDTGIFHSAIWSAGWDEIHPNQQTRQPPVQSEKYQCRIDTVSSPDDGHTVARNM